MVTWPIGAAYQRAKFTRAIGRNGCSTLSRDSLVGQRKGHALTVEVSHCGVDVLVEGCGIGECLMGEVMGLEVVPDDFDVIEFRGVFRQPLDGEPVRASREGS